MKRHARSLLAALAALVILATPALAMRVSPMVVEMESRGSNAVARIEVQNINPGNLAFQTRVFRMEIDKDGNITEIPADQDFLIFPPQGVLPVSGRQVVRLHQHDLRWRARHEAMGGGTRRHAHRAHICRCTCLGSDRSFLQHRCCIAVQVQRC